MKESEVEPLPLVPIKSNSLEERRLWIGNLDPRITDGLLAGKPRGYGFVTYKTAQDAKKALKILNNRKIGSRNLNVKYAHTVDDVETEKPKTKLEIPALAGAKEEGSQKISRETTIHAIEAKLKLMNECQEDFQLNEQITAAPPVYTYKNPDNARPSSSTSKHNNKFHHHQHNRTRKPYNQPRRRR